MRIKPESFEQVANGDKSAHPGTRADRASMHAAKRIMNRHAERDFLGRPIYEVKQQMQEEQLSTAALRRMREGTERLDAVLVSRGLAPSRDKAKALISSGAVTVDGTNKVKASTAVAPDAVIEVALPE